MPLLGAALVVLLPAVAGAGNNDAPRPPANVTLTAASPSSLSISWEAPRPRGSRSISGYELFVDGASAGTTSGLSYEFASLECARAYTLGIEAIDSTGAHSSRASISSSTAACESIVETAARATTDATATAAATSLGTQTSSFTPVADARVHEASPTSNTGTSSYIRVDAGSDPDVESYVRFDVTGLADAVTGAKLRIFATSSGVARPVVYATTNEWVERGITWSNRPARFGAASDESGRVSSSTWIEWDVTEHVAGNGSVSFVLAGISSDGINMGSRESATPPQLVVSTTPTGSADTTAPTAPSGLTAVAAGGTSASLAWGASTDDVGVAGYNVYRDGQKIGSTTGTSYSAGNLSCATTYAFAVEAFDAARNASPRAATSFATGACPPPGSVTCHKYASPNGSDSAAGTLTSPFATPQKLASSLSAGQTGCLRGGSYSVSSGFILDISRSGTTIRSAPGERAKLAGNVQVKNAASSTTLSNLDIEGIGGSNTVKVYAADAVIQDNDITNLRRGQSCMMLGSNSGYGAAARVVVRRNRFHDCGSPANTNKDHAIYASNVPDGQITENVFWNSAAYAIQLYPNAQRTRFANNIVDGADPSIRGGVLFGGDGSYASSNNVVENNVIAYADTYNITSTWSGAVGSGNIARNNCVWAGSLGDVYLGKGGFTASNNVTADPLFVDRAARDYHLGSLSACTALVGIVGALGG